MNVAEIKYVKWEKRELRIASCRFGLMDTAFQGRHMSDDEFEIFHYNVVGLLKEFRDNEELNDIIEPNGEKECLEKRRYGNAINILYSCLICFRSRPLKIKDFNIFITKVASKYFEYVNYYYDLYFSKCTGVDIYREAMSKAEYMLIEWLSDILKQED